MNAEPTTDAELHRQIYALETELLRPEVRASVQRLDTLLADDFGEFGSRGVAFGKTEVLMRLPQERSPAFAIAEFEIRRLASTVVLATYRATITDDAGVRCSLRSSLWRLDGENWRMCFHQGTPTSMP